MSGVSKAFATTGHRAVAFVAAVIMAVSMMMVAGTPEASAANRDFLRADATGKCQWDRVGYWVQRCDVWSPAMGRSIPVQIQPAKRGGNAGLYLLDGLRATDRTSAWVKDVNAAKTFVNDNITVVMPVGGAASFYADWQGPATYDLRNPVNYQWETFLTSELPGYLQRNFGVAPNNNSIAGLSMGGTAAITLAGKHPGQFRQALSYSGYLATTIPGASTLMRLALLDAGGFNLNNLYGSIINPRRFQNDPLTQASSFAGRSVYVSAATGIPGPADSRYLPQHQASGAVLEAFANVSTRIWEAKARATGARVVTNYPAVGLHNWEQFGAQLNNSRPFILDGMNAR